MLKYWKWRAASSSLLPASPALLPSEKTAGDVGFMCGENTMDVREKKWFMALVLLIAAVVLLKHHNLDICRCSGWSMYPTLGDGAIVIVKRYVTIISVGDIVAATITADEDIEGAIKRVVAVDSDHQRVFLSGDNKRNTWKGWVNVGQIKGKVVAILWSGRKPSKEELSFVEE